MRWPGGLRAKWRLGAGSHRFFRPGITTRLLLAQFVLFSAVMAAVLARLIPAAADTELHATVRDLTEQGPAFAHAAAVRPAGQTLAQFTFGYLSSRALPSHQVLIVSLGPGQALGSAGSGGVFKASLVQGWVRHPPTRPAVEQILAGGHHYELVASPVSVGRSGHGVLIGATVIDGVLARQHRLTVLSIAQGALAVLCALVLGYLVLRRVLGTVATVTDTAVRISEGDLSRRIDHEGPDDEIGRMAAAFDRMLGRLQAILDGQRRLLSDVSHQLRTPLTVVRGHLEVLTRGDPPSGSEVSETTTLVLEELSALEELVDNLLLLGRSMETDFLTPEPVDLRAFMGDLFQAAQVLAERRWHLDQVSDRVLLVDPGKLRGALWNLVSNAVRATGPTDEIRLSAQARPDGGIGLRVSDTGTGIPPARQEEIFKRFSSDSPGGAGLGLSIVRTIVEAHGGSVSVRSSQTAPSRGSTFEVVLPRERVLGNPIAERLRS